MVCKAYLNLVEGVKVIGFLADGDAVRAGAYCPIYAFSDIVEDWRSNLETKQQCHLLDPLSPIYIVRLVLSYLMLHSEVKDRTLYKAI
jgi:hypothetical protein